MTVQPTEYPYSQDRFTEYRAVVTDALEHVELIRSLPCHIPERLTCVLHREQHHGEQHEAVAQLAAALSRVIDQVRSLDLRLSVSIQLLTAIGEPQ